MQNKKKFQIHKIGRNSKYLSKSKRKYLHEKEKIPNTYISQGGDPKACVRQVEKLLILM